MAGWLDALWTFNPHPLHQYLIEHNMTQRELSRILEINPVMLSDYLRGKRKPGREVTGRMVKRLDISLRSLYPQCSVKTAQANAREQARINKWYAKRNASIAKKRAYNRRQYLKNKADGAYNSTDGRYIRKAHRHIY